MFGAKRVGSSLGELKTFLAVNSALNERSPFDTVPAGAKAGELAQATNVQPDGRLKPSTMVRACGRAGARLPLWTWPAQHSRPAVARDST